MKHSKRLGQGRVIFPPSIWPYIVDKQPTRKHSKCPHPRLGVSPALAYGHALCGTNLEGNIQFALAMNVAWLQPTFSVVLLFLRGVQINRGAYKEKSLWSVNRRNSVRRPIEHHRQQYCRSHFTPYLLPNYHQTK